MKHLILAFLAMSISLAGFSQTVNGAPLKDLNVEHILIVGTAKLLSNKVTIAIDFGQHNKFFSPKDDGTITDENGKPLVLNSMVDALNFLSKYGYEFVNAYSVTLQGSNVYHWLLRKKQNI